MFSNANKFLPLEATIFPMQFIISWLYPWIDYLPSQRTSPGMDFPCIRSLSSHYWHLVVFLTPITYIDRIYFYYESNLKMSILHSILQDNKSLCVILHHSFSDGTGPIAAKIDCLQYSPVMMKKKKVKLFGEKYTECYFVKCRHIVHARMALGSNGAHI